MSLSIGIVGLPNVGKSTLFNALTKKKAEASNYPFCTIDPNVGVVKVPDERMDKIAQISNPAKIVPTTIEFVDIAGLVKGAHQGEGLGNKFLANIRECDAICEVVRNFKDNNIVHVEGGVNPESDKETVNTELIMADLSTIAKHLSRATKEAKGGDKEIVKMKIFLSILENHLNKGQPVRTYPAKEDEIKIIKKLGFLTQKPIIYILNVNDSPCGQALATSDGEIISLNIKQEAEIAGLSEEEQAEYIAELGLEKSGLDKLILSSYRLLNLITFFTTGPQETKAWTITKGMKAPQAAGKIHTDFAKGFIRVEAIGWQEFIKSGGEQNARDQGLIRTEGKEYIVQDGDICHFLFNL